VSPMERDTVVARKFRILLADENKLARLVLTFLLRKAPSIEIVGEASGGQTAIDMIQKYEPDAIVIDSFMQIVGGSEAFRVIQAEFPKVQIIELSSFDNPASRKQIGQAAGNEHSFDKIIQDAVLEAVFLPTNIRN
jgi:two-component system, NarL family, response regulator